MKAKQTVLPMEYCIVVRATTSYARDQCEKEEWILKMKQAPGLPLTGLPWTTSRPVECVLVGRLINWHEEELPVTESYPGLDKIEIVSLSRWKHRQLAPEDRVGSGHMRLL